MVIQLDQGWVGLDQVFQTKSPLHLVNIKCYNKLKLKRKQEPRQQWPVKIHLIFLDRHLGKLLQH